MKKYWLGTLLLISMPGWAIQPFAPTPAEEAMCQARVYSRLGPRDKNTMHMHHYCSGLRFLNRAYAAMSDKKEMRYNAERSLSNFDYVLSHTEESYAMRGEVHLNKGRSLKLLRRNAQAVAEFNKALRYEIDSPDAYQALADHFQESGNKTKALEMVTEGLRRNPDSKGLKRRYTEFGGKLPYPEPLAKQSSSTPDAEAPSQSQQRSNGQEISGSGTATPPETNAPVEAEGKVADTAVSPPVAPPKIGSPTNPWCRFCPDPAPASNP